MANENDNKTFLQVIWFWSKWGIGGVALIFLIVSAFKSYAIVPAGHKGVVLHWSAAQLKALEPGLHIIMPWRTSVYNYPTRVQKTSLSAEAASKDMQEVTSKVAINWTPDTSMVGVIYDKTGGILDIVNNVMAPNVQESFKAATAHFSANEVLLKRAELKKMVDEDLRGRLEKQYNIVIRSISIEDVSFSKDYMDAIEKKQVAEQQALQAGYLEQKAASEAKAVVATAKGLAQAQKLQAVTISDKFLELRKIEVQEKAVLKWDGVMPKFNAGSGLPMILDAKDVMK